jgi:hypothetical protein
MIIFLDLDGVLVDFVRGALVAHGEPADTPVTGWSFDREVAARRGITPEEFWAACDEAFWAGLDWTADGRALLAACETAAGPDRVFLLSTPCKTRGCLQGKQDWVDRHLPAYSRKVFFGAAKEAFAGPGKVLVDDYDKNVERFQAAGGWTVLVPRPWNQRRYFLPGSAASVVRLDLASLF